MNQEWHEERHSENVRLSSFSALIISSNLQEYEPSMRSCIFYTGWLWCVALLLTPRVQTFASVVAPSHQAPTVRGMPPHQPPLCCKPAAAPPPQFCHEMPRRVTAERLLTCSLTSNSGQLFFSRLFLQFLFPCAQLGVWDGWPPFSFCDFVIWNLDSTVVQ